MSVLSKIRELIAGGDADGDGHGDGEDDAIVDACPAGGEHEWKDVNAANLRTPVYTFCVRCKQRRSASVT